MGDGSAGKVEKVAWWVALVCDFAILAVCEATFTVLVRLEVVKAVIGLLAAL